MRGLARPWRDAFREELGQSMVEFALILPVFVLMMMGVVDLGQAFWQQNELVNAVREGARVGIYDQTTTSIKNAVKTRAPVLNLSDEHIIVTCYSGFDDSGTAKSCGSVVFGDGLKVVANKSWSPITPLIRAIPGIGNSMTLTSYAMRSIQ